MTCFGPVRADPETFPTVLRMELAIIHLMIPRRRLLVSCDLLSGTETGGGEGGGGRRGVGGGEEEEEEGGARSQLPNEASAPVSE